jgi:hypothetical protein
MATGLALAVAGLHGCTVVAQIHLVIVGICLNARIRAVSWTLQPRAPLYILIEI